MRLGRLIGLGVAVAVAVGTAGGQQPAAGAPRKAPPDLTLWSPSNATPLMTAGAFENFFVSVDRDAYVAAFEVGRDGRMRVLYPRSPKDAATKVKGGKTLSVYPWSYDMLGYAVSPTEVPFVVALASDDPIDLSRFGQGKTWQYRVRVDRPHDADATMEKVARLVAQDTTQRFAGDYGFVAPRISPSLQMALARCTSLTSFSAGRDAHDYWFYRDLWMSFGPRDGYWLASVSPWIGWGWSGFAPMLFPSVAAWPTPNGGCTPTVRLPAYAVAPRIYDVPQRPDTARGDSTKTDTTKAPGAGSVGRTIAVEQPGAGGVEAVAPGEARRFSPGEITRARTGFYAEPDANQAHAEMIAGRHAAAPADRRGVSWAPEPIDARPTSRGAGGSRYAEQEERTAPRWPSAGVGPRVGGSRNDPERAYGNGGTSAGSGSYERPTGTTRTTGEQGGTVGAPRTGTSPSSPVTGGERGTGTQPRGQAGSSSSSSSSSASPSSPASSSAPAPRGQQQQQNQ